MELGTCATTENQHNDDQNARRIGQSTHKYGRKCLLGFRQMRNGVHAFHKHKHTDCTLPSHP